MLFHQVERDNRGNDRNEARRKAAKFYQLQTNYTVLQHYSELAETGEDQEGVKSYSAFGVFLCVC